MSLKYCAIEDFVLIVTTFRISNATLPNFLAVKLSKQRFKHYESFTRVPDTRVFSVLYTISVIYFNTAFASKYLCPLFALPLSMQLFGKPDKCAK